MHLTRPRNRGGFLRSGYEAAASERLNMADIGKIEYRVIPITRYTVTRYYSGENTGGVEQRGEYNNANVAYEVGYALARAEHDRLGWPLGDERIKYPESPGARCVVASGSTGTGGFSA